MDDPFQGSKQVVTGAEAAKDGKGFHATIQAHGKAKQILPGRYSTPGEAMKVAQEHARRTGLTN